jgi:uncharacterized membrane protein YkvA (DUF1232 family)
VSSLPWPLLVVASVLVVYAAFVIALIVAGRWQAARSVAGFIPDCMVLLRRLLGDSRVPRRHKLLLGALIGYLALPLDLVPDFIPVAGQLDDAVLVALVLCSLLRSGGEPSSASAGPARRARSRSSSDSPPERTALSAAVPPASRVDGNGPPAIVSP